MKKFLVYFLFFVAVLFLFFFWTDRIPLWSSDEGRYGEIAREMWETKDFITPHFNYVPYLAKPVLAPALTALSYAVFGINAFSTRLVSILAALLGILLTYSFARKLFNLQTAKYAALLLATTIGYVLVGRFAIIDMLMSFFVMASLLCLMTAYLQHQSKYYLAAYVLIGLAFLTKGLIGLLFPAMIFLVFLIWVKNIGEIKRMHLGWGMWIVALVTVPWCIAISLKEPEFFNVFIIQNHFVRFTTSSFARVRPFWFFVPIAVAVTFPWSFFMPAAIVDGMKKRPEDRVKIQFLLAWIVVIFLFISIPKSKLPYYLLPMSVPWAILVAAFFSNWIDHRRTDHRLDAFVKWTWNVLLAVCLLAVVGVNAYLVFWAKNDQVLALKPILQIGTLIILAGSLAAYYFYKKNRSQEAVLSLAGMVYLSLVLAILGMKAITPYQSSFAFAETVNSQLQKGDKVAVFASPDHFSDFLFYLKKRVIIVGSNWGTIADEIREPELTEGEDLKNFFLPVDDFIRLFNKQQDRIFCFMRERNFHALQDKGLKNYTVVKRGYGQLLIANM